MDVRWAIELRRTGRRGHALLTLGLAPIFEWITSDERYFPEKRIKGLSAQFKQAAGQLSDPSDREPCVEFVKEVLFAFYMGRAQHLYKVSGNNARNKVGLNSIGYAVEAMGFSEANLESLSNAYFISGLQGHRFELLPLNIWTKNRRSPDGRESPPLRTHLNSRFERESQNNQGYQL